MKTNAEFKDEYPDKPGITFVSNSKKPIVAVLTKDIIKVDGKPVMTENNTFS